MSPFPAPTKPKAAGPTVAPPRPAGVSRGKRASAQKVVVYGPGGVGKTELCSLLSTVGVEPLFIDLEDGTKFLDVARVDPAPDSWEALLAVVRDVEMVRQFGAVVIDSFTKAEEYAVQWTVENVPHEKGHMVKRIEDYGFGKGFMQSYQTFLGLLQSLDALARLGVHIIATSHDCTASVPNPAGEDWIRYEPRLQSPPSGKGSIRHRVKEWCDHLLYVGFDVAVGRDGKATGVGTRAIYPTERPTYWAKSRSLADVIPYEHQDAELWRRLIPAKEASNAE